MEENNTGDKKSPEKNSKKTNWLLVLLLLLLFILPWWRFRMGQKPATKNQNTSSKYVQCTFAATDKTVVPKSWVSWLYSAPLKEESSGRGTPDSGKREFSLKSMEQKVGDSVYFRLEREGFAQKEYVTGVKLVLEICDDKNQTSEFYSATNNKLPPAGEKISASIMHLHNNPKVFHSGTYRIDALINFDGKWQLVNRMDSIRLSD